mgnify:CR=1 FL=1
MLLHKKNTITTEIHKIMELTPCEADAIIAAGTNMPKQSPLSEYDSGRNQHLQILLKKLHGK